MRMTHFASARHPFEPRIGRANDLWTGDIVRGPKAGDGRKTCLIAFIDDATLVVPHAAFAFSEDAAALLPALNRAIASRGAPRKLRVDGGPGFRPRHLAPACAKLGIALLHAGAGRPEGKGKAERWFGTVSRQFLPTLREADAGSLEALNLKLRAWVEGEYHRTPHRGLDGMTPLEKWAAAGLAGQVPQHQGQRRGNPCT